MDMPDKRSPWIEVGLYSVISALIYIVQFLPLVNIFLFLVPLYILYKRRGEQLFKLSLVSVFTLITVARVTNINALLTQAAEMKEVLFGPSILIELTLAAILLAGFGFLHLYNKGTLTTKLTGIAALSSVAAFIVYLYIQNNSEFLNLLKIQAEGIVLALQEQLQGSGEPLAILESYRESLLEMFLHLMLFGMSFMQISILPFIVLGLSWRISITLGNRFFRIPGKVTPYKDFYVDQKYFGPLLIALGGFVVTMFIQANLLNAIAINALIILFILYGAQGVGIISSFLNKSRVPPNYRFLIIMGVVFAAFYIPVFAIIMIIGIPGLGISETWIKYRNKGEI